MKAESSEEMTRRSVLVIDDDDLFIHMLKDRLSEKHNLFYALDPDTGLRIATSNKIDIALLDLHMNGNKDEGLKTLEAIRALSPETTCVMVTGTNSSEFTMRAINLGAVDYVVKSKNSKEFEALVDRLRELISSHVPSDTCTENFGLIVGESEEMRRIRHEVSILGKRGVSVLITGETGTGKEIVAQALHREYVKSTRKTSLPFVTINSALLQGDRLSTDLFGHVSGAFTSAHQSREGYFRHAGEGTLFFDEIGELPLPEQSRLLRVFQERVATPMGSEREYPVRCRTHCATNRDLKKEIEAKRFREDLYYRIAKFQIDLPPLRCRKSDIPLLVSHFIRIFNKQYDRAVCSLTKNAREKLQAYNWPGNVRELYSVIEEAFLKENGPQACLDLRHFSVELPHNLDGRYRRMEETLNRYLKAFHDNGRSFARAARDLALNEATLRKPLAELFEHYPILKIKPDIVPVDYIRDKRDH